MTRPARTLIGPDQTREHYERIGRMFGEDASVDECLPCGDFYYPEDGHHCGGRS